jgi:hypothetical protein
MCQASEFLWLPALPSDFFCMYAYLKPNRWEPLNLGLSASKTYFFSFSPVLGMELGVSYMLDKHCTSEPHLSCALSFIKTLRLRYFVIAAQWTQVNL